MSDGRWLIEWMRMGSGEWRCCGPLDEHSGFAVVGSTKFRTPVVVSCDRTATDKSPRILAHMMGPGKDVLGAYDDSFWERWYLPPGVHPCDVTAQIEEENRWQEKHYNEIDPGDEDNA